MKKAWFLIPVLLLVLVGCKTMPFDRDNLKAEGMSLNPKLANLKIIKAETLQLGSEKSLTTSSYLFTIFRREIEEKICDLTSQMAGSIEMEVIYAEVSQNPGWSSKNEAGLEFEIHIFDLNGTLVWTKVYSGTKDFPDPGLAWSLYYSDTSAANAMTQMEHILLEELKIDLQNNYPSITRALSQ